ncbi:hypothetical protein KR084_011929 [Drosophila pseudotakahashii]|nr:hypothetical protein KR084_011929 [Drosophila pseudotakahashii]
MKIIRIAKEQLEAVLLLLGHPASVLPSVVVLVGSGSSGSSRTLSVAPDPRIRIHQVPVTELQLESENMNLITEVLRDVQVDAHPKRCITILREISIMAHIKSYRIQAVFDPSGAGSPIPQNQFYPGLVAGPWPPGTTTTAHGHNFYEIGGNIFTTNPLAPQAGRYKNKSSGKPPRTHRATHLQIQQQPTAQQQQATVQVNSSTRHYRHIKCNWMDLLRIHRQQQQSNDDAQKAYKDMHEPKYFRCTEFQGKLIMARIKSFISEYNLIVLQMIGHSPSGDGTAAQHTRRSYPVLIHGNVPSPPTTPPPAQHLTNSISLDHLCIKRIALNPELAQVILGRVLAEENGSGFLSFPEQLDDLQENPVPFFFVV